MLVANTSVLFNAGLAAVNALNMKKKVRILEKVSPEINTSQSEESSPQT